MTLADSRVTASGLPASRASALRGMSLKALSARIFIGRIAAYPEEKVQHALERLSVLAENGWERELRLTLNHLLPEARLKVTSEEFPEAPATKVSGSLRAAGAEN
jgi:hypothetical protein